MYRERNMEFAWNFNILTAVQAHLRTKEKQGERKTDTETIIFFSILHAL